MSAYLFTPAARTDLEEIWDYSVEQWGEEKAEAYIRQIRDACEALASGRKKGRAIDGIRPGYLKLAAGSHFLFFRFGNGGVIEVVRILHERMDVPAHLDDR